MQMPGRKFTQPNTTYRYGFNGQEKSDDVTTGNYTAEYWEYDSRIVRRWNVDPVEKIWESPYLCFSGNPIVLSDPNGDDAKSGDVEDPPKKGATQTQHSKGAQDGIAPNGDLVLMGKKNTGVHIVSTNLGTDKKADFRVTYFFVEGENGGWSWNNEKRAFTKGDEEFSNGFATAIFNKVGMGAGTNLSEASTNVINGEPLKDTRKAYFQYKQNGGGGAVPGFIWNGVTTSLVNWADDMQAGGNRSRDAWIGLWNFSSNAAKSSVFNPGGYGFSSFSAFKRTYGAAGTGQAWHHIVEQTTSNIAKFGPRKIHNTNNLMRVMHGAGTIHSKVSAFYSSIQPFSNGQTVRKWLSSQSYQQQYNFGIKTLKQFSK